MNVPKLRFKEFHNPYELVKTDDYFNHIRNGFVGTATPYYTNSKGIKYLQSNNVKNGRINENTLVYINEAFHIKNSKSILKENDVLMVQSGHAGDCAVVTSKYVDCNCHALIVMSPTSKINTQYYVNYLHSPNGLLKVKKLITGNTIKHILASDVKNIVVPLPSLEEQNKIAAYFSTLEKKIQMQQEKIDLLKEQKKAYQLKLLNNKEWKTIRLGDYTDIKGRLGWKGLKQDEYVDNGPFLIAGKHIIRGEIQWDRCDMIPFERYEESMEIALENGDVIFSKDGSLGNPAYITNLPDKATINSTMMLVRVHNKKELDSNFVYHILNSHVFRKLIHLKVSGSSIPHLFQADMKEFSFSVPKDINEQKQIVNLFNLIDRKIYLSYEKLDSLKAQKQAFMQQMFI